MFTHYRTEGIFLLKKDRGEADQLFTIFTKNFGKLEVLGRAVRKIKSKLRSSAELFYLSEIEFIQGKNYKTLTDAILIDKFKKLRENPQKLEIAYEIAEALNSLTGKEEQDMKTWQLLRQLLKLLNHLKLDIRNSLEIRNLKLEILFYYFLWNLFSILGYSPQLYHCPVCHKKLLPDTLFFVPGEGGVVCWQCFSKLKKERKKTEEANGKNHPEIGKEIEISTVKAIRLFLTERIEIINKLKLEEKDIENFKEISDFYLAFLRETIQP